MKIVDIGGTNPVVCAHKNGVIYYRAIPQYTTDWRLAGELLEEMATPMLKRSVEPNKWVCGNFNLQSADTPQMAICLAWLEWSEG